MNLMDNVLGAAQGLGSDTGQSPLLGHVLELVSSGGLGGLTGLIQKFKDNGMGDLVTSWIGTGANLPVSPAQIEKVLGAQQVQQLVTKSGLPTADVLGQLTRMLPDLINKLSPNGSLPMGGLLEQGIGLLKSKFLG